MIPDCIRQFCLWADKRAVEGRTSDGTPAKYVPHSAQSRYWNENNIRTIIESRGTIISVKDVGDFICIFSILVYMEGKGTPGLDYLAQLMSRNRDDASLPWTADFNGQHEIFGSTDHFKVFIDNQWMFYPMPKRPFLTAQSTKVPRVFMPNGTAKAIHNHRVEAKQIFPIAEYTETPIDISRATRRVTVSYMKIHSPSDTLPESTDPEIVVFKRYPPAEEATYKDEYDAYTALRDARDSGNILQCLGSFYYITKSGEQFSTIMLELADSGTLWDLFSGNKVPYQSGHVRDMWESLLGALHGLAVIHDQASERGFLCFHQDLKPSNLFLFSSNDNKRPFRYTIKIGDFGSSHSQPSNPAYKPPNNPDKGATRTYGPPETHLGDTLKSRASQSVDMWAFGCIIIEMAVWIMGGKLALDDFRRKRQEDNRGLSQLERLGRSDCFHDGSDVLNSVKAFRHTINENRRQHDNITPAMVDIALKHVLIGGKERLYAEQLLPKFYHVLRDASGDQPNMDDTTMQQLSGPINSPSHDSSILAAQREPRFPDINPWSSDITMMQSPLSETLPSPSVASPSSPPGVPNSSLSVLSREELPISIKSPPPTGPQAPKDAPEPAMNSSFPFVSIDQLKQWIVDKKKQSGKGLPGRNEAKSFLGGRDFIFLLDNSRHTRKCREEMNSSVTALTYLLKDIDDDGVEVVNTSAPHDREKIKTKTQMSSFVERNFRGEIGVDCMIEDALNAILEPIKSKWSRPRSRFSMPTLGSRNQGSRGVTILIFTNGIWDHTSKGTCGAERPILSLIESMREHKVPRTQVSIQFVRLGSEERGIGRLRILDDELSDDFDIVDTKPITASIWNILIGSIQPAND